MRGQPEGMPITRAGQLQGGKVGQNLQRINADMRGQDRALCRGTAGRPWRALRSLVGSVRIHSGTDESCPVKSSWRALAGVGGKELQGACRQ